MVRINGRDYVSRDIAYTVESGPTLAMMLTAARETEKAKAILLQRAGMVRFPVPEPSNRR